jgi:hypothetical protein
MPRPKLDPVCPCGRPATAGRYKKQGDYLCHRCYQAKLVADPAANFKRYGREYIAEVKRKAVCVDCIKEGRDGKWPGAVLHFDHVPERGPKLFNVANCDRAVEVIKAEIAKCDIVCANHHAIRTWITRDKPWIRRNEAVWNLPALDGALF